MIGSLLISIGVIVGLMFLWILVQHLWGQSFAEHVHDADVMAGRTSCSNCGCTTICENKQKELDNIN